MFPFIWWLQGEQAAADDGPHDGGVDFLRRRAALLYSPDWNPSRLRPSAWYTADPEYITLSGSNITTWRDRSGFNNHLIEVAPTTDPALNLTGWNGAKAAAVFTPTDDNLRTTGPVRNLGASFAIFAVIDLTANASYKFLLQWTNETTEYFAIAFTEDEFLTPDVNVGGNNIGVIAATGRRTIAVIFAGSLLNTYIDDAPDLVNDPIGGSPGLQGNTYMAMGVNALGANGFNGGVREVVVMPYMASRADYMKFRGYAKQRHGGL